MCSRFAEKSVLLAVVVVLTARPVVGDPAGKAADSGWAALELAETEVEGVRLCYEPSFAPDLEAAREAIRAQLPARFEQRKQIDTACGWRDAILARVNEILGIDADNAMPGRQRQFLETFRATADAVLPWDPARADVGYCLVSQSTIKSYLQRGGELPGFRYDPRTDRVTCEREANTSDKNASLSPQLPLPVPAEGDLGKEVANALKLYE